MSLSQSERDLAAEIDFDESVLEVIKQECQAEMQKLLFEQEVYLKDSELSCLNDVLPSNYLDFIQDIYGTPNYAGNLFIEGLSIIAPAKVDCERLFFQMQHLLALKGYLVVYKNQIIFLIQNYPFKQMYRRFNYLFRANFNLAVFKGEDTLDIIKIYQTNGWNYNISPRDIINKLKNWQKICKFDIIFANNTSLSVSFTELPENILGFAKDVREFCPNVQSSQSVAREIEKYKSLYLTWD